MKINTIQKKYGLMSKTAIIFLISLGANICFAQDNQNVKVTFVANEGFLISSANKKVLIDALYSKTYFSIVKPSVQLIKKMENAEPPFDSIDLICITHEHEDHFDKNTVGRHLESNPKAKVICSEVVGNLLKSYSNYSLIKDRILDKSVPHDSIIKEVVNGIPVTRCGFWESVGYNTTDHQGFIIDLDSTIIFHGGDSEGDTVDGYSNELKQIDLKQYNIDIAFLINDYFWAGSGNNPLMGLQKVQKYIDPKNIVIMHNYSSYLNGGQQILDAVKDSFPNIYLFKKELEVKKLIGDSLKHFNYNPYLDNAIKDTIVNYYDTLTYTIPWNTFADDDIDNSLTLTAKLAQGDPLPTWITFNETTNTFSGIPNDFGLITIEVTAIDNALATISDIFEIFISEGEGISNNIKEEIKIFPNPTTGIFTLSFGDLANQETRFEIHNSEGKLVLEKTIQNLKEIIDLSCYPSGMYILKIKTGPAIIIEKITIE